MTEEDAKVLLANLIALHGVVAVAGAAERALPKKRGRRRNPQTRPRADIDKRWAAIFEFLRARAIDDGASDKEADKIALDLIMRQQGKGDLYGIRDPLITCDRESVKRYIRSGRQHRRRQAKTEKNSGPI
jgi:hypothetical protein